MASKALFDVPKGATARVRIIDSTFRLSGMPISQLMQPPIDGLDTLPTAMTWSFLIESPTGKKALFDLGVPPDIKTYAPAILNMLEGAGWDLWAEKHVAHILKANGIDPAEINSVIWSHWHFDHIGDITTFPGSTEVVVGPGFKDAFLPGYPAKPDSPVREKDFEGRQIKEIEFSEQSPPLKTGAFRAFDFFGDGSFYLLDTPGHAIGHLSSLARTTSNPDTFIFMGGDLCHHSGEIRPSPYLQIPRTLNFPLPDVLRLLCTPCPGGELFEQLNIKRGRKPNEPFFDPCMGSDIPQAIQTIKEAQAADAQDDVFFIFAHDRSIVDVVDQFPLFANDWKAKGWREKTLWTFLKDFMPAFVSK